MLKGNIAGVNGTINYIPTPTFNGRENKNELIELYSQARSGQAKRASLRVIMH